MVTTTGNNDNFHPSIYLIVITVRCQSQLHNRTIALISTKCIDERLLVVVTVAIFPCRRDWGQL